MSKDGRALEDYIVTMSNTVVLGKQWQQGDTVTPENLMRPSGLLMYTDRGEVDDRFHETLQFPGRISTTFPRRR